MAKSSAATAATVLEFSTVQQRQRSLADPEVRAAIESILAAQPEFQKLVEQLPKYVLGLVAGVPVGQIETVIRTGLATKAAQASGGIRRAQKLREDREELTHKIDKLRQNGRRSEREAVMLFLQKNDKAFPDDDEKRREVKVNSMTRRLRAERKAKKTADYK